MSKKAYKVEISFMAYGETAEEAIENLRFDIFEALKDGTEENVVSMTESTCEAEGIDEWE